MSDSTMPIPPPVEDVPVATGHQRMWSTALPAALIIVVLVAPIVLYVLLRGGGEPAGAPAPGTPGTPSSMPVPSTTATTGTPPGGTSTPDGRIPAEVLKNATLVLPAWPADNIQGPSGPVPFTNGIFTIPDRPEQEGMPWGKQIAIVSVTYGDVDRDGAEETIAELDCMIQNASQQVVAFERDGDGDIVTLGRVLATTGPVRAIKPGSVHVTRHGAVAATVGDLQNCCGGTVPVRWQDRSYSWNGHRFRQTGGPAVMPLNPYVTETGLTVGDLLFGPAVDGYRTGTLAVTITHRWGTPPVSMQLRFAPAAWVTPTGTDWPAAEEGYYLITVAGPPPNASVTYRYTFRQPAGAADSEMEIARMSAVSSTGQTLTEAVPDSRVTVTVRAVG